MFQKNFLKLHCCLSLLIVFSSTLFSQNLLPKKHIHAIKTIEQIYIDGKLHESVWSSAQSATDFVQFFPHPGEASERQTKVHILYDDEALYIGAQLFDEMEKVDKDLSERDDIRISDWFGISFDTYQDGRNGFEFRLSAAGVQADFLINTYFDDWDAVWESAVYHGNDQWTLEMKIPFSELRFINDADKEWQVNFSRKTQRDQELAYWNPVDPLENGVLRQGGILRINALVDTPLNLSATSYAAGTTEKYENFPLRTTQMTSIDLKYGINTAFTFDTKLLPDIGYSLFGTQTTDFRFSNEINYAQNRQFNTEGGRMFSRANLFSEGRPLYYPSYSFDIFPLLSPGETIINKPRTIPQTINASKFSGRTKRGTGIGVYNAITAPTFFETVTVQRESKKIEAHPLTNYNVVVLDQNLPNNSFISLTNTSVMRNGAAYDANVIGLQYVIRDRKARFSFGGEAAISQQLYGYSTRLGHKLNLSLSKIRGNWRFGLAFQDRSPDYDQSDLSFSSINTFRYYSGSASYNRFQPRRKIINASYSLSGRYSADYFSNNYQELLIENRISITNKKLTNFRIYQAFRPMKSQLPLEVDNINRYFFVQARYAMNASIQLNQARRFSLGSNVSFNNYSRSNAIRLSWSIAPQIRISDRLNASYDLDLIYSNNSFDLDFRQGDDFFFDRTKSYNANQSLSINYSFNKNMTLSIRGYFLGPDQRSYSTEVLLPDGTLAIFRPVVLKDFDKSARMFADLNLRWRFAPGSDFYISWRQQHNDISTQFVAQNGATSFLDLLDDIDNRFVLSMRVAYYINAKTAKSLNRRRFN